MKVQEKNQIRRIKEALLILPENKREFILGYAEGVIAMNELLNAKHNSFDVKQDCEKSESA